MKKTLFWILILALALSFASCDDGDIAESTTSDDGWSDIYRP